MDYIDQETTDHNTVHGDADKQDPPTENHDGDSHQHYGHINQLGRSAL